MAKSGKRTGQAPKRVEALKHDEAKRKNIPTAELQSLAERTEEMRPKPPVHYARITPLAEGETRPRDGDLDPQIVWNGVRIRLTKEQIRALEEKGQVEVGDAQLVWRGKDTQDWSDLVVQAPPLYIQEKIHPKVIIDDLVRRSKEKRKDGGDAPDLFADFNGLDAEARTEFYQHDQHWSNRMILGDSLQVMASLAEREGLKGKVQCIYFDPPYGIKFNSNWQVSTASTKVEDGKRQDVSREPEQVKAFRDTWKDGIHSYLTYLRDRLTVSKELLATSGSIFVQISDENVHRVRALLDEIFGDLNFAGLIAFSKTTGQSGGAIPSTTDFLIWYARDIDQLKVRHLTVSKPPIDNPNERYVCVEQERFALIDLSVAQKTGAEPLPEGRILKLTDTTSQTGSEKSRFPFYFDGKPHVPAGSRGWSTSEEGLNRVARAGYLYSVGRSLMWKNYRDKNRRTPLNNSWLDLRPSGFGGQKLYVVETEDDVVQRCILMASDPGDLILDPTCGSGTTAYVAEQWGRRWITIDTSRVALALARARIMGARYPYYFLADTPEGREKEQEITGKIQHAGTTEGDIRQGFVYERAPHITLKSIAKNATIDVIWEEAQKILEPLRTKLNTNLGEKWQEWELPRDVDSKWDDDTKAIHEAWWKARIARQSKIDDAISKDADLDYLFDRPFEDKSRVRVAGPFTVESLSPHRVVPADEHELLDLHDKPTGKRKRLKFDTPPTDFAQMVLENLRTSGVQQSRKADKIVLDQVAAWPGVYVNAEALFMEGGKARRAAIFIGPEFGTVSRIDLVAAAREATEARFDALIACAFNFDAHSSELTKLGPLPIIKAKMNPDLHMADDLKNTGKGNLFVVFGEPDIDIRHLAGGMLEVQVKGIDVFDPNTGEIRSDDPKDIAAWFIDTDYNEESFFVRHAYFLGAQDPYKSLKSALKAEIDPEAWAVLYRETSRPFPRPETGRIAVKVINHFGDEVMKVFGV